MPDSSGLLSDADKVAVSVWLATKIGGGWKCPACKNARYYLGLYTVQHALYSTGGSTLMPPYTYPLVLVSCDKCSLVQSFKAISMGLYAGIPEPPVPAPPSSRFPPVKLY